jgi:NDP-sugar pyrophosphorylase family protein/aminoglycoside/choline kinase family phosphotransferase
LAEKKKTNGSISSQALVMKAPQINTAFLLGAGLGMRLRPLTQTCPKPLLPVRGRPIITYAMDHLLTVGVQRFIVNTHHCADVYRQTFPDGQWRGIPIIFRHEPVLLDTAGGLKNIEALLKGDERILVYNADVMTDMPLTPLLEAHVGQRREVTLALRSDGPLLNVDLDEKGEICDMRRLLNRSGVRRCLFTGLYVVEKRFLKRLTAGKIESVVPVFVRMIEEKPGSVGSVLIDRGQWHDIGSLEEYRKMMNSPHSETAKKHPAVMPGNAQPRPEDNEKAQPFETIADAAVRQYVCHVLNRTETAIKEIAPLAKGGSDRTFRRICLSDAPSLIFMHYNPGREENRHYAAIAGFLRKIDLAVPRIFHHDPERCFMLMEDLGDADLWSFRQSAWSLRRDYYIKALRMIHKLHTFPVENLGQRSLTLMQGFGPELYRWERDYFHENLIRGVCGIELGVEDEAVLEAELSALAKRLQQSGSSLVHRDFQSQNIMINRGEPVLIDFQGMRVGSYFYDLGSLLYDPYVLIEEQERLELLQYYYGLQERTCTWDAFQDAFHEASVQRLMQALGAFGFLGCRHNRRDFLAHIPSGLQRLDEAASRSPRLPTLRGMISRCRAAL